MMATAADTTRNNCPLCHLTPLEPKLLHCGHHVCKECIDKSLHFADVGSASMQCPHEDCWCESLLDAHETSNDLPTYTSVSTSGCMEKDTTLCTTPQNEEMSCGYTEGCMGAVSAYCCGYKMCTACSQNHTTATTTGREHKKVVLYFHPREKQLRGYCEEHRTCYTHVCGCDNTLLCVYCLHRHTVHKQHTKTTIQQESQTIREALLEDYRRRQKLEEFRKATEAQIPVSRAQLEEILRRRKEECMAQYTAYLNEEEEKIKNKFQDICGHVERIAELSLQDGDDDDE